MNEIWCLYSTSFLCTSFSPLKFFYSHTLRMMITMLFRYPLYTHNHNTRTMIHGLFFERICCTISNVRTQNLQILQKYCWYAFEYVYRKFRTQTKCEYHLNCKTFWNQSEKRAEGNILLYTKNLTHVVHVCMFYIC